MYDLKYLEENKNNISVEFLMNYSTKLNYIDGVKTAIKRGIDINKCNGLYIINAIENDHIEIVKLLINNNVRLNNCKYNLVNLALASEKIEIAELLLKNKCEFNESTQNTCLSNSIYSSDIKTVKFLLEYGVNCVENVRFFNLSIEKNNIEVIKLLVMHGCDINKLNSDLKNIIIKSLRKEKLFNLNEYFRIK